MRFARNSAVAKHTRLRRREDLPGARRVNSSTTQLAPSAEHRNGRSKASQSAAVNPKREDAETNSKETRYLFVRQDIGLTPRADSVIRAALSETK